MKTAPRERAVGGPGSAAGAAVEVVSLCKNYGAVQAVRDVSFCIERGEVFAFLGPNGAGKTTTVRMLCTLTRPGGGNAAVAGFDVARQATTAHALGHLAEVARLAPRDWLRRTRRDVRGAGGRQWLIAASLAADTLPGLAALGWVGPWLASAHVGH